ncbi:MAG: glycosyltransferase [Anaerolineae bacterium]|nr:MAG: glycosyltransferase [Anaerolineae bacterium]
MSIVFLLRRLRPFLFPKNSLREVWARYLLAVYSRLTNCWRGYARWQKNVEQIKKAEGGGVSIETFSFTELDGQTLLKALSQSQAEYILLAAAPLLLADSALDEIKHALQVYPETDLIYTDGDWLDRHGKRIRPWFKPAFGIDSLRAQNYIVPFFAIRKVFGDSIGWFDPAAGSAWAEDLIWRAVERARQVIHIPKVLYHQLEERMVAFDDERRVLERHLERVGWPAEVAPGPAQHTFHLRYHLRCEPLVSILIPNHDLPAELKRCLHSILTKSTYQNFEILILENNSRQPETFTLYEELQRRDGRIRLVEYHHNPFNYAEINNFGASQARGEMLLFLNNDTEVITPDWLERMLEYAQRPDVGAVGAKLYYPQGLIQHVGVILGLLGAGAHQFVNYPRNHVGYYHSMLLPQNFSMVTAACLMTRREVFWAVQGFDSIYRLAFNDFDLCLKIREQGYLIAWTPYAELYHHESLSRGYDSNSAMLARLQQERETFTRRWRALLQAGDPYYNPNLALDRGYYSLRFGKYETTPRAMPGLGGSR